MSYTAEKIDLIRNANPPAKEVKEAVDSFEEFWLKKHSTELILYHYTTAQGMKGILKNRSFWCTDVNYVNDELELKYGKKIILEILNKYIKKADDQNIKLLLKILINHVNNIVYDTYIACFSENDDILSQWNNYANSGRGYNLGIKFNNDDNLKTKVSHYLQKLEEGSTSVLRRVFYEIDEQNEIVNKFIADIVTAAKKTSKRKNIINEFWGADAAIYAANILIEIMFSLKSPSYKEEKEWRLVYMMKKDYKKELRKFRVSQDVITPYLNMYIFEKVNGIYEFPLQRIKSGPMLSEETSKKSIEIFIENVNSFSNHPIKFKM